MLFNMRRSWSLTIIALHLQLSIVITGSVTDERSVNFLQEDTNSDLQQRFHKHLMRLRRSSQVTTTTSPSSGSKFKIGRCSFENFLRTAQNCSAKFYETLKSTKSARKQCKNAYEELRSCMSKTLADCIEGTFSGQDFDESVAKIKKNFLISLGDQDFWCIKGGLGVASEYLPRGYNCDPVFYHVSEGCTAAYRRFLKQNATNYRLCKEYEKAKACYIETLFRHCSFDQKIRRAVEIMVQISDDLQPFCNRPIKQEESILERLIFSKSCPSYSLADVAFAIDVTNDTDRKQYVAMKRIIERLIKRMDYGSRGIQVAVFQYDTQLRNILKFGRPRSKSTLQRRIRRMIRTTTKSENKANRMTGRALLSLGKTTFAAGKEGELVKKPYKSGQRPHNPAVLFVLTTGRSTDSVTAGLKLLKDRNVHVVFAGPPISEEKPQQPRKDVGISHTLSGPIHADSPPEGRDQLTVSTTFKFREVKRVVEKFVKEICSSDRRTRQLQNGAVVVEGPIENSRFIDYDLLHLFELRPIVFPVTETSKPTDNLPYENHQFVPIYEGGMNGDVFMPRQLPGSSNSNRWPFYMNDNEYYAETTYGNSFFTK